MLPLWFLGFSCAGDPISDRVPNVAPPARVWHGGEAEDGAGQSVATGDVDQDGRAELLIGAPSTFVYGPEVNESHSGAYLLEGDAPEGALDDVATASFYGWKNGDYIGMMVAISEDLTGDGAPDVIITGEASEGPPVDVQVYAGPVEGRYGVRGRHARVVAATADGPAACCTARCGDLDGDGTAELCPGWGGGPTDWGYSGAYVFRGPVEGDLQRDEADVQLHAPSSEAAGGPEGGDDLTGDGLADLRVKTQSRDEGAGGVYVVDDPPDGIVDLADYPFLAGDPGASAGSTHASGGDLDGDGRLDLFVSGHLYGSRTGRAWVVTEIASGPMSEGDNVVVDGSEEHELLGIDGVIGDFDGDGAADLAVGISGDWYSDLDTPGRVAVFRGPLAPGHLVEADADVVLRGSDHSDGFGARLAAGDVDGDGDADLVVGAPVDSAHGERAGAVYLFHDGGL
jgi:hypothetical protein